MTDSALVIQRGGSVKFLNKPFYSLPVVNLLNAGTAEEENMLKEKSMICPGVRVLVVDDEPMNLMVAEGIFRDYQMSVTTAESGRKAIELCEKEGFDEFISKPIELLEMERILRKVLPKSAISFVDENSKITSESKETQIQTAKNMEAADREMMEKISGDNETDNAVRLEDVGIHTHTGMQYCGGDKKFYVELLIKFALDAGRKKTEMDDFYKQEDWENYAILVHALKSTAKMVGADTLSENARQSEMAAKKQDADYIREHHDTLLTEYQQVSQCILHVFDVNENDSSQEVQGDGMEISKDDLLHRLTELKEKLDTYEADKAEALIKEMKGIVYRGESLGELLHTVWQDVDDFEFALASEKVEALIRKMEGGEM